MPIDAGIGAEETEDPNALDRASTVSEYVMLVAVDSSVSAPWLRPPRPDPLHPLHRVHPPLENVRSWAASKDPLNLIKARKNARFYCVVTRGYGLCAGPEDHVAPRSLDAPSF